MASSLSDLPNDIQPDEAFEQLSADVDYLASALGRVIIELEGQRIFDLVEEVRSLTKRLRTEPDAETKQQLIDLLAGLSLESAERVLRAFTVYFQLINLAEEIHRVRVTTVFVKGKPLATNPEVNR